MKEPHSFKRFKYQEKDQNSLLSDNVQSIFSDDKGLLWIATDDGLDRFDLHDQQFYHDYYGNQKQKISHYNVQSVLSDRAGNLWVGTEVGFNLMQEKNAIISKYYHQEGDDHTISNNTVHTIYEDREGIIWLGTDEGINYLDIYSTKFSQIRPNLVYNTFQRKYQCSIHH